MNTPKDHRWANKYHRELRGEWLEARCLLAMFSSTVDTNTVRVSVAMSILDDPAALGETGSCQRFEGALDHYADRMLDHSRCDPHREKLVTSLRWGGQTVDWFDGEWILRTKNGAFGSEAERANALYEVLQHLATAGVTASVKDLHRSQFWLLNAPGAAADQIQLLAEMDSDIIQIEPNLAMQPDEWIPTDPRFHEQWHLRNVQHVASGTYFKDGERDNDNDATKAWDVTRGSHTVVVGVIDSGISYDHPDLANQLWTNPYEIPGNGIDDEDNGCIDDVRGWDFADGDNDPLDFYQHGTAVAGVIAAEGNNAVGVIGVAPEVRLLPLKIARGSSSWYDLSAAIASVGYLIDLKEHFGISVAAANMSFSGPTFSQAFFDVLAHAQDAGIYVTASAGNLGGDSDQPGLERYPASYELDNIFAVASINVGGSLAPWSNWGVRSVDLAAPGVEILTTFFGTYTLLDGTSFAAPQVAATVALLVSDTHARGRPAGDAMIGPQDPIRTVREAILQGVVPSDELASTTASGGRLNIFNSLQLMRHAFTVVQVSLDDQILGTTSSLAVRFSAPVDEATFGIEQVALAASGDDMILGTPDDVPVPLTAVGLTSPDMGGVKFPFDLAPDSYRLTLSPGIRQSGSDVPLQSGEGFVHEFEILPSEGALEHNDSLFAATDTGLISAGSVILDTDGLRIGDGYYEAGDVDLFKFTVTERSLFRTQLTTYGVSGAWDSLLDSYVRIFDETGREIAWNDDYGDGRDSRVDLILEEPGVYFVGVSAVGNDTYDPAKGGSGRWGLGVSHLLSPYESLYEILLELTPVGTNGVAGLLWHDLDGNQILDPDREPGLANWTVFLDLDLDQQPSPGEPMTTTIASGEYVFPAVWQSSHTTFQVTVKPPPLWTSSRPWSQTVVAQPDRWVETIHFGFRLSDTLFPTILVTRSDDLVRASGGETSTAGVTIREALQLANHYPEIDTIEFDPGLLGEDLRLWKGQLVMDHPDLTLRGLGSNQLVMSALPVGSMHLQGRDRLIYVKEGAHLTLMGLTLSGGQAPRLCERSTREAASGGGIFVAGRLDAFDVVLFENKAFEDGGGVYVSETGYFSARDTRFTDNRAFSIDGRWLPLPSSSMSFRAGGGGGLANAGQTVLGNSWLDGNCGHHGAGVYTVEGSHTVIDKTTLSGNSAGYDGGGLRVLYGTVIVTNSTITNNVIRMPGSGKGVTYGHGGGVAFGGGPDINAHTIALDMINTTIVHNEVSEFTQSGVTFKGLGGGIYLASDASYLAQLRNCIVAGNLSPLVIGRDVHGLVATARDSRRNNLIGIRDGSNLDASTDLYNITGTGVTPCDPRLGETHVQGGLGPTYDLLSDSPARDAGYDPLVVGQADQRGFARLVDGNRNGMIASDIGAVESAGDFDGDDHCDCSDLDRLMAEIAAARHDLAFDLTQDALVDLADRDRWLAIAGAKRRDVHSAYSHGDANLDGVVDDADFARWNANKFTAVSAWSQGDFNADGVVDGSDFAIWNANKFTGLVSPLRHPNPWGGRAGAWSLWHGQPTTRPLLDFRTCKADETAPCFGNGVWT